MGAPLPIHRKRGSSARVWYLILWVRFFPERVDNFSVISSLWVLFPLGSTFFWSLWLFNMGLAKLDILGSARRPLLRRLSHIIIFYRKLLSFRTTPDTMLNLWIGQLSLTGYRWWRQHMGHTVPSLGAAVTWGYCTALGINSCCLYDITTSPFLR